MNGAACSWRTYNGAQCPFTATKTSDVHKGRWMCEQHAGCESSRRGDQIVFDEFNRAKAELAESENGNVQRLAKIAEGIKARNISAGQRLYNAGMQRAVGMGVPQGERHAEALAYVVDQLGKPATAEVKG